MAHQISAAALRTARVLINNYELTVRPPDTLVSGRINNLTNSEAHVAIIVDHATNIFQLTSLRPEVCYWQTRLRSGTATAPQIAGLLKRLLEGFETIPKNSVTEEPVSTTFAPPPNLVGVKPLTAQLSKPAKEVSRFIFHYYIPKFKTGLVEGFNAKLKDPIAYDENIHRVKIAQLAEACLGLRRLYTFFPKLEIELKQLVDGQTTESDVRKLMRDVGVVLEYIPTYEDRREEGKILT